MLKALTKSLFGSSNDRYVKSMDKIVNQIKVHPHVRQWALVALARMLDLAGSAAPSSSTHAVEELSGA
mgnify:CR=1 FL=1